jgi:hypothetical protein
MEVIYLATYVLFVEYKKYLVSVLRNNVMNTMRNKSVPYHLAEAVQSLTLDVEDDDLSRDQINRPQTRSA